MIDTRVCIIGIWHLGAVTSACLASLGLTVVGVDFNEVRVDNLNHGIAPLYEPGLDELLVETIGSGHLTFTTDLSTAVQQADYIVLAFDTPLNEKDEIDLSSIYSTCERIAPNVGRDATVVVFSQVPVGTCERLAETMIEANPNARVGIAYVPENLRLGQAIERFTIPIYSWWVLTPMRLRRKWSGFLRQLTRRACMLACVPPR
jgi:UDPglucose 6-dehydrogenase